MNMDGLKSNGFSIRDYSIRECFEKFVTGLEAKEKHLKDIQESIAKSSEEIDLRRQSAEKLVAWVTKKEEELKQMQLFAEKGLRDWEAKKREMGLMLQKLEGEQKRVAEELEKLENFQKSWIEQWKIKEKILTFRAEKLDAKEKELVAREKLLDLTNTEGLGFAQQSDSASQKAEDSARYQSKKGWTRDDGDQVKALNWDSVKDMHAPSPSQQPPMPTSQTTLNIPEQMQQQADAATIPTASSVKEKTRIVIKPLGVSFSNRQCEKVIQDSWDRYFADKHLDSSTAKFSDMSTDDEDKLFTEFKQIFCWSSEHDALIYANWKSVIFFLFDRLRDGIGRPSFCLYRSMRNSFRNEFYEKLRKDGSQPQHKRAI